MSSSQPVSEAELPSPHQAQPVDPRRNPSYPQRLHIQERAHWQGVLKSCDDRVNVAKQKLNVLASGAPNRASFMRLYAQMLGARDQVYDAARRLPGETGDLYEEDHHRLEQAVAALDRVLKQWDSQR